MSIGSKVLLLALAATFVAAEGPRAHAAPRPPLCTAGRFAVAGAPLLGPGGELVVLENRTLALGTLCPARRVKLRRQKNGTAVVIVYSKGKCTGVNAKVRVKALISQNCSVLTGTLRTKGQAPADFTAATSVCGDAVVDTGLGEQCDGSATGCQVAETCNDACQCQPTRANKSSPIEITADGRKVVAVNTDTDTASFFQIGDDELLTKLQEVAVGQEPRSVATLVSKPWAYVANTVSGTVSVITPARLHDGRDHRRRHRAAGGRRVAERPLRLRRQRQQQHGERDRHEHQRRLRDHPGRPQPARARHHQRRRRGRPRRAHLRAELLRPPAHRLHAAEQRQPGRHRRRRRGLPGRMPTASRSSARASSTTRARA